MFGLKREEIYDYVDKQYGIEPEYFFEDNPSNVVFRHQNGQCFAVFMQVEKQKLGLPGKDIVDIMNVKCDPALMDILIQTKGVMPGYQMDKKQWLSVILDGTVRDASVLDHLDMSYDFVDNGNVKK